MSANADHRYVKLRHMLEDWADWQRGYAVKAGYPRRSAGMQSGYVSTSFDEMCDQVDARVCKIVDASIDDLPVQQQSAIAHRYLHSVFRFPRLNYAELLQDANDALVVILVRKGVLF